jgi:hypothetical protein
MTTPTVDDLQTWITAEFARRTAGLEGATDQVDPRVTWPEVVAKASAMGLTLTDDELRAALGAALRARLAAARERERQER